MSMANILKRHKIKIFDEDDDYDGVLWDFYHIAEKGLS